MRMMAQKQIVQLVEHAEETTTLVLGSNYPFLQNALKERLEELGSTVFIRPQKGERYDYIIVLGKDIQDKKILALLSHKGKVLRVVSDSSSTKSKQSLIQQLELSATRTFSQKVLTRRILIALFNSKPFSTSPSDENATKKQEPVKKKTSKKKHKHVKKIAVAFLLLFFTILTPFLVLGGSLGFSAYTLTRIQDNDLDTKGKQDRLALAQRSQTVTTFVWNTLEPVINQVSQDSALVVESTIAIIGDTLNAADEVFSLSEKVQSVRTTSGTSGEQLQEVFPIINTSLSRIDQLLASAELESQNIAPYKDDALVEPFWPYFEQLSEKRQTVQQARSALSVVPDIAAFDDEKKYLVLFQNNFELRPTGGFIGSFAIVTVKNGAVDGFSIYDVYDADGQLKGEVEPPEPIAVYLNQPNWFLRDANWNPDFALSAEQVEWFLNKEMETTVDGVVATDLYTLRNILSALDGIYIPDYQATVTANDFFLKLQSEAHDKFFPGSNKKQDLISSFANTMFIEFNNIDSSQMIPLLSSLHTALEEKHVLIYMHDKNTQTIIEQLGWGGRLVSPPDTLDENQSIVWDYSQVTEANLGVNKVNYHVERELFQTLSVANDQLVREFTVHYRNNSPKDESLFSGTYSNYVRFLLPEQANIQEITVDSQSVNQDDIIVEKYLEKQSVGFFVQIPPQSQKRVRLLYTLPVPAHERFTYQLMIQKQPGTDKDSLVFKIGDTGTWEVVGTNAASLPLLTDLSKDQLIIVDFELGSR